MRPPEDTARLSLLRSMLLHTLFLAAAIAVCYWLVAAGGGFAFVSLTVVGAVGLLLAWHVGQHLLDLRSPLAETEGIVLRKWKRADLIIAWDSFYIGIGRAIFRIAPEDWVLVDEGSYVKVVHFPRTLHVVSVHEVRRPPAPPVA